MLLSPKSFVLRSLRFDDAMTYVRYPECGFSVGCLWGLCGGTSLCCYVQFPVPRFRELFKTSPRAASSETEKVLRKTPRSLTKLIENAIHLTVWLSMHWRARERFVSRWLWKCDERLSSENWKNLHFISNQLSAAVHWLHSLTSIHGYLQTLLTCFDNVLLRPYQWICKIYLNSHISQFNPSR